MKMNYLSYPMKERICIPMKKRICIFRLRNSHLFRFLIPLSSFFATSFFLSVFQGASRIPTNFNLFILFLFLFGCNLLFRIYLFKLRQIYGFTLVFILHLSLFLLFSLWLTCFRNNAIFLLSSILILGVSGPQIPSLPGPSAPAGAGSSYSDEDAFGVDVLLESWPTSTESGTSVNQPEAGPVAPANQINPRGGNDAALGLGNFPDRPNEVIGGDSVDAIQRRLLGNNLNPTAEELYLTRLDAQDRFEIKVQIIHRMEPLYPGGDWDQRGAEALVNNRTPSGEESLEKLYQINDELQAHGVNSKAYQRLVENVPLKKRSNDEHSST
jgi:hypothetical protein